MATVGTLAIDFIATGIGQIKNDIRSVRGDMNTLAGAARMVGKAMAGFASVETIRRIATGVRSIAHELGDVADAAEKAGVSAEKLQVFRLLGEDVGAGAGQADAALTEFTKRVGQAQAGAGKLLGVAKAYRVELTDQAGKARTAAEIMGDLSDIMASTTNTQERLRIAAAMGMEDFVAALAKGRGGLDVYEQKVRATGLVINEHIIAKADEFDKNWYRVSASFSVFWKSNVIDVLERNQQQIAVFLQQVQQVQKFLDGMTGKSNAAARAAINQEHFGGPRILEGSVVDPQGSKSADTMAGRAQETVARLSQQGWGFAAPAAAALKEQSRAARKVTEDMSAAKNALDDYATAATKTRDQVIDLATRGINRLEDSLTGFIAGTKSAKEAFRDFAASVIEDMIRMQVQQNVTGGLAGSLSSLIGGLFSRDLGGGTTVQNGIPIPGTKPTFARGGVANRPSIFGESGAEAAVPLPDGRSIPVTLSGKSGGDTYYIDARGADQGGLARLESMIHALNGSIEPRSIAAFEQQFKRTLSFGR